MDSVAVRSVWVALTTLLFFVATFEAPFGGGGWVLVKALQGLWPVPATMTPLGAVPLLGGVAFKPSSLEQLQPSPRKPPQDPLFDAGGPFFP